MSTDGLWQIRSMAQQYRLPLLIALGVVCLASLAGRHINSADEATTALARVYNGAPHFEVCLKQTSHPTR
jgi:hypothetical protein